MRERAELGSFGRGDGWRLPAATRTGPVGALPKRSGDHGMVTAEMAASLPALVAVAMALAWLLGLGALQGTVAAAAREGARAAARGETNAEVRAAVHHLAPAAAVTVRRAGGRVAVTASLRPEPSSRLLRPFAREVRATSTSWREGG